MICALTSHVNVVNYNFVMLVYFVNNEKLCPNPGCLLCNILNKSALPQLYYYVHCNLNSGGVQKQILVFRSLRFSGIRLTKPIPGIYFLSGWFQITLEYRSHSHSRIFKRMIINSRKNLERSKGEF